MARARLWHEVEVRTASWSPVTHVHLEDLGAISRVGVFGPHQQHLGELSAPSSLPSISAEPGLY